MTNIYINKVMCSVSYSKVLNYLTLIYQVNHIFMEEYFFSVERDRDQHQLNLFFIFLFLKQR